MTAFVYLLRCSDGCYSVGPTRGRLPRGRSDVWLERNAASSSFDRLKMRGGGLRMRGRYRFGRRGETVANLVLSLSKHEGDTTT